MQPVLCRQQQLLYGSLRLPDVLGWMEEKETTGEMWGEIAEVCVCVWVRGVTTPPAPPL